jgi:hypothetical protein
MDRSRITMAIQSALSRLPIYVVRHRGLGGAAPAGRVHLHGPPHVFYADVLMVLGEVWTVLVRAVPPPKHSQPK